MNINPVPINIEDAIGSRFAQVLVAQSSEQEISDQPDTEISRSDGFVGSTRDSSHPVLVNIISAQDKRQTESPQIVPDDKLDRTQIPYRDTTQFMGARVKTIQNSTLFMVDDIRSRVTDEAGGPNFAEMYGIDTSRNRPAPHNFTREEVEKFYFCHLDDYSKLTREGEELYEAIKVRYLDAVPRCQYGSPTLYFTGGLPGSGKGYILNRIMKDNPQFVRVDPDEIKIHILGDLVSRNPELRYQIEGNSDWNSVIHETSSALAKRLMGDALESGKDIVFDSSMATKNRDKYRRFAQRARANGYKIYGVVIDVTEQTAIERAKKRSTIPIEVHWNTGDATGEQGVIRVPGRSIPLDYFRDCSMNFQSNVDTFIREGLFDRCVVFDNNSPEEPARIIALYEKSQKPDGSFTIEKKS